MQYISVLAFFCLSFLSTFAGNAQSQQPLFDSTFSTAGFFSTEPGSNGMVTATAVQPDGKVLLSGDFVTYKGKPCTNILRLNPSGEQDSTFDPTAKTNGDIFFIRVQNDGKIILGGSITAFKNQPINNTLIRLKNDGTWDSSFTPPAQLKHGTVALTLVALQPDGKILVGGFNVKSYAPNEFQLIRLNDNGSIDAGFNLDASLGSNKFITSIIPAFDDKLWLSGDFSSFAGKPYPNLVRLNSNGTVDTTFQLKGTGFFGINATDRSTVKTLLPLPDGSLLAGGPFYYCDKFFSPGVIRIRANGTIDSAFSTRNAFMPYDVNRIDTVGGKVLVGGLFYRNGWQGMVLRLNNNGSIDNSFSNFKPDSGAPASYNLHDFKVLSDKSLLMVGGFSFHYQKQQFSALAHLSPDGVLDQSFQTSFQKIGSVYKTKVTKDGKIMVGGAFNRYGNIPVQNIVRLLPSGALDTTFQVAYGPDDLIVDIAEGADSSFFIAGLFKNVNGHAYNSLAKLRHDGTLDTAFFRGTGPHPFNVNTILPLPDGKIVVGGAFGTYNNYTSQGVVRLLPNGWIDTSFRAPQHAPWYSAGSIAAFSNGALLIGDNSDHSVHDYNLPLRVWKLHPDGSIDSSFRTGAQGGYPITRGLVIGQQDRIYVYNELYRPFTSTSENYFQQLLRLNGDGSNHADSDNYPDSFYVRDFKLMQDSSVLITGPNFNRNDSVHYVMKLKADLSVDSSFNPVALYYNIHSLDTLPGGQIVVGGEPTRFFRFDKEQIPNVAVLKGSSFSIKNKDTLVQNSFGVVHINNTAGGTLLTLVNNGSSQVQLDSSLQQAPQITGTDAAAFEVDVKQVPAVLKQNDTAVFAIRLKATTAGAKQARLIIPFNNGVQQQYALLLQGNVSNNSTPPDTTTTGTPPPTGNPPSGGNPPAGNPPPAPPTGTLPPPAGTPGANQVVVSPNPNHGTLYIQSSQQEFDLFVYDAMGKLMYQKRKLTGNHVITIQLGKLPAGYYWVQLKSRGANVTRQIFVL